MSDGATPTDPEQLRSEIDRTRADLGDTVQALAAKTDVKARAKHAAGTAADEAKQKLTAAKDQTVDAAIAVKDQIAQGEVPPQLRRPMPWAALAGAAALAGLVVVLIRRRRA
jgi:LPXTG-motif cell wall-anchored protein